MINVDDVGVFILDACIWLMVDKWTEKFQEQYKLRCEWVYMIGVSTYEMKSFKLYKFKMNEKGNGYK